MSIHNVWTPQQSLTDKSMALAFESTHCQDTPQEYGPPERHAQIPRTDVRLETHHRPLASVFDTRPACRPHIPFIA